MRVRAAVVLAFIVLAGAAGPSAQVSGSRHAVSGRILVKFTPGASASARAAAHQQGRGVSLASIARTNVELVRVTAGDEDAAIARYARNPNVLVAEPNHVRYIPRIVSHDDDTPVMPADFYFDEQYALHNTGQEFVCFDFFGAPLCLYVGTADADIDAPEAWAVSTGEGTAIRVAVIDSGIDYNHPDLVDAYVGGWDYVNNDDDPMDDHGHGTHVSGTVAARMNNLTGALPVEPDDPPQEEEGVVGVAPHAKILAYKVCDTTGACDDFRIQSAMAQAVTDGAKVINLSLGDVEYSATLDAAVQDAWAAGLVIVAGAGNEGTQDFFYPAALPNVISVAAFDEDHRRPTFTNYGWPKISAPGHYIISSVPLALCGGASTIPGDTGCYDWNVGTSMATPHVSGAAALLLTRPDVTTNQQVVDIILGSADPVGVDSVRLDSWTEHGGLNLHEAMSFSTIPNQSPVANAGADQTVVDDDGNNVEDVTLNGSGSTDLDGSITSYVWRVGTTQIATGVSPSVALAVGSHTVTLEVTDNRGAKATDTVSVTVQPQPPAVDTVTILKAQYNKRRRDLVIEATSSAGGSGTVLTAYDISNPSSPVTLGTLTYNAKRNRYSATFGVSAKPTSVRVTSSRGGSATTLVTG